MLGCMVALCCKGPEFCVCRVAALQNMLVPLCDIPAADQILILSGKPLDARRQLSAYGLPVRTPSCACSLLVAPVMPLHELPCDQQSVSSPLAVYTLHSRCRLGSHCGALERLLMLPVPKLSQESA